MAVQERNSEMVSLLSADFIQKTDTVYLAGIVAGSILMLPGLVAFWPMGISLSDSTDIYADYAYLPGRSGGQTLNGGTAAGDDLTLRSTSNATKGNIFFGNSTYDEVNNRLGVGTTAPTAPTHVKSAPINDATYYGQVIIEPATDDTDAFICLRTTRGADRSWLVGCGSGAPNNNFRIYDWTASAERLSIDSSGNLGIGTTSPDGLQVNTPVSATARSADNVRMGVLSGLPTIILEESASVSQWIIDNSSGTFRLQIGSTTYLTIDGNSVWFLKDVGSVPGSNPSGGGYLFVDAGALKFRGSSGTVTVVAPA